MKDLLFEYDMHLDFEPPVEEHRFTLKCIPQTDERQLINRLDVEVYPKEFLSTDKDSFGNYSIYGYTKGKHDRFFARIRGGARTGLAAALPAKANHQIGLFKYQTDYTRPGPAILAFAKRFEGAAEDWAESSMAETADCGVSRPVPLVDCAAGSPATAEKCKEGHLAEAANCEACRPAAAVDGEACRSDASQKSGDECANAAAWQSGMSTLDFAVTMMHTLYENFSYVKGVTDVHTTAEEAMALGKGVCQDYAHILLSLCRIYKIPCRYVVGMLIGEGLSHAWVEVCDSGYWYALDPTNNLIVDDAHIKISSGRDYHDCIVSQGVFVGRTKQTQTVAVRVKEANV
ncbi:MAG: transglutaminase family protein [Lachnospiraceae bacterium]|nr:transglutaminase family protein [Lachnospiraceae bacterium]